MNAAIYQASFVLIPTAVATGAGDMMHPANLSITQGHDFLNVGIVFQRGMGHDQRQLRQNTTRYINGKKTLLNAHRRSSVKVDLALKDLSIGQGLRQQRGRLVYVFYDRDGLMSGSVEVAQIQHGVIEGEHHDFIAMPDLAFIANGLRSGTACRDQALAFARNAHVTVTCHLLFPPG